MDRPALSIRLSSACFVIAGMLLLVLGGLDAAHQLEILSYREASAAGTVAELGPSGSLVVSFQNADSEDVRFEHNTILGLVSYVPPYSTEDIVVVRYRANNAGDAGIIDSREWFGIAIFGVLGLFFIVWGWLIGRFAMWGGLAGFAGLIAIAYAGNPATAAALRYFGY